MAAHRLVQIERGAARRIEAREPHRADEDEAEGIGGILELFLPQLSFKTFLPRSIALSRFLDPLVDFRNGIDHPHSHLFVCNFLKFYQLIFPASQDVCQ